MDALKTRDMDEVNSKATLLLQIGDAFMNLQLQVDFVDPIYIDIQRHGTFDEEKITYLK
jgi:hypothetical protein